LWAQEFPDAPVEIAQRQHPGIRVMETGLRRMSDEMFTENVDQKVSLVDPILRPFAHRWSLT
jgi:hypothetical protein